MALRGLQQRLARFFLAITEVCLTLLCKNTRNVGIFEHCTKFRSGPNVKIFELRNMLAKFCKLEFTVVR